MAMNDLQFYEHPQKDVRSEFEITVHGYLV